MTEFTFGDMVTIGKSNVVYEVVTTPGDLLEGYEDCHELEIQTENDAQRDYRFLARASDMKLAANDESWVA